MKTVDHRRVKFDLNWLIEKKFLRFARDVRRALRLVEAEQTERLGEGR